MEIVCITFESELSFEELEVRFRERAQQFRDMDGLLQKFYIHDEGSGRVGGLYIFDSEESRDALFESEIHAKLRDGSDIRNLVITPFDVVFPLYESGSSSAPWSCNQRPDAR